MLDVAPFVATRYRDAARLPALTSAAYDLIELAERERLAQADAHSIVHLTLADLRAADAAMRFAAWRADATMVIDDGPALYLYDIADPAADPDGPPHGSTRGWVGAVALDPAAVAPHEDTVADVVAGRWELRAATGADLEPVVLAHDGDPGPADALGHRIVGWERPLVDLVDDAGVRHRIWRLASPAEVATVVADLGSRRAVIADGHHRWAAARAYRDAQPGPGRGTVASRCSCRPVCTARRCWRSTGSCPAGRSSTPRPPGFRATPTPSLTPVAAASGRSAPHSPSWS